MSLPEDLKQNLDPQIHEITRKMTKLRRDFHQYPEIGFEEDYAHGRIKDLLYEWELPHEVLAKTGLVVTLEGLQNTSKKIIALRADMDALSVHEESDVSWKSRNKGKMHACGHDGHMASVLGALSYLKDHREFNGTVKVIFQPAEEGKGGAKKMIEEGIIKKHKITAMYAFHNWPDIPFGKAAIHTGPVMASSTNFEITIQGKGCHGAMPEQGNNPIPVAFEVGQKLGTLNDECLRANPDEKIILSVCSVEAGNSAAMNIIPSSTKMTGTFRTYNLEIKDTLREQISKEVDSIASRYDIQTQANFPTSTAPTINNPDKAEISRKALAKVIGDENIEWDARPAMTAEDFGEFSSLVPVSYIWIGNACPDDANSPHSQPLHNPKYGFNDDIIPIGVQYFANVVKAEMPISEDFDPDAPPSRLSLFISSLRTRISHIWEWLKAKARFWKKK